jgi:hypothetical protein
MGFTIVIWIVVFETTKSLGYIAHLEPLQQLCQWSYTAVLLIVTAMEVFVWCST